MADPEISDRERADLAMADAYAAVFTVSAEGRLVLADLEQAHYYHKATLCRPAHDAPVDPLLTAHAEGQRFVVLRIRSKLEAARAGIRPRQTEAIPSVGKDV